MHRKDFLLTISLAALVTVLLAGCSGDCEWNAIFRTWIDENENGVWDNDEPPLPDVKCSVEGYLLGPAEATSNEQGKAHIQALVAGCHKEPVVFVYVLPPSGYRASHRSRKPAPEGAEPVFEFGFVPVEE